jgi:DNA-binding NtrC family response regulator
MNILVVDNDRPLAEQMSEMIAAWGHTAKIASTGEQAIGMLAATDFDVVILDVSRADQSDLSVVRRLKETKPSVDVVAMNGENYYNLKFEADLKRNGCFYYTIKPRDRGILLQRVLEHILIRLGIKKMKNKIASHH